MIVVTGSGRTGTSLMMQTLGLLGVELSAPPFNNENNHIKSFNKKGFFELQIDEMIEGVNTLKYVGKAVKLFGSPLSKTHPGYISHVIVCKRHKVDATESYKPVAKIIEGPEIVAKADEVYDANYRLVNDYLEENNTRNIEIKYEDMRLSQIHSVNKVIDFLSLQCDKKQIEKAINNIN